ncbi:MAG: hypothetical protein FWH48_00080, partial [Oscillospiraceae bacterium]|nr:hypothetical protein [Oscillospiraceae bacterium]
EVGMNEEAARPDRFKLTDLKTDFVINASVNMRMLFLSMPFAQKGINGIVPPKTAQFFASCYRGY